MRQLMRALRLCLFLLPLSIAAQKNAESTVCGLSTQDSRIIYNNMLELRERYPTLAPLRAIAYVPVWFHLVARTDGTGRVSMIKILDMLCEWNRLYAANGVELRFYIKGINNIDYTPLYDGPRTFDGDRVIRSNKKNNGLNVFMVNNANDPSQTSGTVLGYYQNTGTGVPYEADWLVVINSQASVSGAVTIAHEAGHFFGLPHTFQGWESCPFQPSTTSPCAPATIDCYTGVSMPVENAARTGTSANCATAGDGFCDTPPDYNLGYGFNGCSYIGLACDPKGIKIDPDEKNMMSYFSGCENAFSPMQKTAMQNNYLNDAKRAYLRAGNLAVTATSLATPTLITPINNVKTSYSNNFNLGWSAVTGATAYVVEISKTTLFTEPRSFIALTNALNVNKAMAVGYFTGNTTYYWRVKAYNNTNYCSTVSAKQSFMTGLLNETNDIESVSEFEVAPTPLSIGQPLMLNLTTETPFEAHVKIVNAAGQLVKSEKRHFEAGFSSQTLSVSELNQGFYILTIESEKGVLNKKIVLSF